MELDNSIKIPMIISVILQGVVLIINIICYFAQSAFIPEQITISERVLPARYAFQVIVILMYVAFLLTILTYKGESRRMVGVILFIVYGISIILGGVANWIGTIIQSRNGEEYAVALSVMNGIPAIIAMPFANLASILMIVAVARFGVSKNQGLFNS